MVADNVKYILYNVRTVVVTSHEHGLTDSTNMCYLNSKEASRPPDIKWSQQSQKDRSTEASHER